MEAYIATTMPKAADKKRIEAHLEPELYATFHQEAIAREWSDKKMAEKIIQWYIEALPKKSKK